MNTFTLYFINIVINVVIVVVVLFFPFILFDPFFTPKFTRKNLSLLDVLGVVQTDHGGSHIESVGETGAAFTLPFPAQPAKKANQKEHSGIILVIDDEEIVREAVTEILTLEGLEVMSAANGQSGIELYREQAASISLILLDMSMPGLSGQETFRQLQEINPEVSVILSSGYSYPKLAEEFNNGGVVSFLPKPYHVDTLIQTVRAYLS